MRADRLVEILLILQARGQVTAKEVAEELEISERTARRDLDALGMAGLPIYSVRGRNGGWRLLGDGRTDLSGLSASEVRALFLVAGPQTANGEVRSALRKLVEALPETFRSDAEAASDAIVIDEIELGYVAASGEPTLRTGFPLGLASKGSRWYFLADTDAGRLMFRVDRVTAAAPTGDRRPKPADFDLAAERAQLVGDFGDYSTPVLAPAE
ncbi:MAG: putative DNA-binding transcriptional regulator YafY [Candidatus Poriferisodalaceae bacterium]|jgi:predicted DNA-binding transcriptional regulator YafY